MEGTGTEHLSNLSANASGLDGNDSEDYIDFFGWETEPYLEAIVVPVVFGFIFVVGLIGNGTLIFTVAMNKVMRNVPNILIVSLSLGDFLLILISVPLNSTVYTFTSWPYGEVLCKFNFFMQTWSLGITVFTLTALSIDRYLAIVDPMSKHKGKTHAKTMAASAGIWILSLVLALPDAFLSREITLVFNRTRKEACYNLPEEFDFDAIDKTVPKIYYMTRFIVFFAIPVVVITCFYLLMAQILIRSGEQMPCEGKGGGMNQQRQIAARKKVARIVLSFVFIFVVCWLPRHIYLLWWYFDEEGYFNEFWHVFKILGFCLTFINSCVNPFALYFLSSQFRKYYNRYLFCCFKKLRYTRMEPSSTMQNFNSTVRRASSTNTSMVQSQSMC
nr:hypothetical protein BaRGS_001326 [Batillaria attramentaria]